LVFLPVGPSNKLHWQIIEQIYGRIGVEFCGKCHIDVERIVYDTEKVIYQIAFGAEHQIYDARNVDYKPQPIETFRKCRGYDARDRDSQYQEPVKPV
jgi:hypothetical protein